MLSIFIFLFHCFDCSAYTNVKMIILHNFVIIKWPGKWNNWLSPIKWSYVPRNVRPTQNLPNITLPVLWRRRGRWVVGMAQGRHPAGGQCPPQVAEKGTFGFCPQLLVTWWSHSWISAPASSFTWWRWLSSFLPYLASSPAPSGLMIMPSEGSWVKHVCCWWCWHWVTHTQFYLEKCSFSLWSWESNCCLFTLSLSLLSAVNQQWLSTAQKLGVGDPAGPWYVHRDWSCLCIMKPEPSWSRQNTLCLSLAPPLCALSTRPACCGPLQTVPLNNYRFCVEAYILVIFHGQMETIWLLGPLPWWLMTVVVWPGLLFLAAWCPSLTSQLTCLWPTFSLFLFYFLLAILDLSHKEYVGLKLSVEV